MELWIKKIESSKSIEELESVRVELLGKKGVLTLEFAKMKDIPNEEKKSFAQNLNLQKEQVTNALDSKKELLEYQIAAKEMNFDKLDALRKNDDFLIKDYAILHEAIILVNQEEYEKAKAILEEINQDSKVYELAILLKHNLVTK